MQHVYTFDSLGAFIQAVDVPKPSCVANDTAWNVTYDDWAGASRADSFSMARFGWPEGREHMVTAMARARPAIALAPAFTLDVAGAYPDPCAAAAGVPDCMVSYEPEQSKASPVIRMAVNVWASGGYDPKEFTNYGAAVLSYIDAIESSGFRVELTMLCHCEVDRNRRGDTYSGRVMIKRAEDPMDIDRLTFCLTHPAMLRRLWFTHMQIADGVAGHMSACGYPKNPDPKDVEPGVLLVPGINCIYPGNGALKSPEKAAKHISAMMDELLAGVGAKLPAIWGEQ